MFFLFVNARPRHGLRLLVSALDMHARGFGGNLLLLSLSVSDIHLCRHTIIEHPPWAIRDESFLNW